MKRDLILLIAAALLLAGILLLVEKQPGPMTPPDPAVSGYVEVDYLKVWAPQ